MGDVLRICLWSGPRNVSTALMYAFAQRQDTRVLDEPLYGHYLRVTGAEHPDRELVVETMENDAAQVIENAVLGPCDRPVLFMKQMTHHLVDIDRSFLARTTNLLLTRDPVDMLPSLANVLDAPTMTDAGYKAQYELLRELENEGHNPPILDSRELLKNPRRVLSQLCERLGLPFTDAMLSWKAGPRPEDGVWAKHWYGNVHRSTAFQPYRPKRAPFPTQLAPLLNECRPYYDALYERAIKADN